MTTRRTFLSLFAMAGASGLCSTSAHAQRRRFRSPCLPTRTDRSPAGKDVSKKNPEFIQPDYRKWEQVTIGMHQNDVLALLGNPLYRQDRDPRFLDTLGDTTSETYSEFCYYWNFGHLDFAQPAMPLGSFDFSLGIHYHTHTVRHIWQPFAGPLSEDGVPTIPGLFLPNDNSRWSHYPRFLDLRWKPSSGRYPIKYEIEIGSAQGDGFVTLFRETAEVPHYPVSFVGMGEGRWRVRAENRVGRSKWSDYWYFRFTV